MNGSTVPRVIDACVRHGAAPPVFEECQGFVIFTFQAAMVPDVDAAQLESQPESQLESQIPGTVPAGELQSFFREPWGGSIA